ncbi:MAG: adenine phosphoribosyltransferase [Proteobacteria bacterium]|nr:adenine phosphoribosyltransferase [Pseudomonadota bacterium]
MPHHPLKKLIRDVPNFPKEGILFRDISPLLADGEGWRKAVDEMAERVAKYKPDMLAGIDARGFLVAAPVAYKLGIGFAMVRKKGKLPWKTVEHTYELEYGSDTLQLNADAFAQGQRVVICDDLLATGGTAGAAVELVRKTGGNPVALACLIELAGLGGAAKLGIPSESLLVY